MKILYIRDPVPQVSSKFFRGIMFAVPCAIVVWAGLIFGVIELWKII
jgi:hypothetical protein